MMLLVHDKNVFCCIIHEHIALLTNYQDMQQNLTWISNVSVYHYFFLQIKFTLEQSPMEIMKKPLFRNGLDLLIFLNYRSFQIYGQ
jgi:hypothetical protein